MQCDMTKLSHDIGLCLAEFYVHRKLTRRDFQFIFNSLQLSEKKTLREELPYPFLTEHENLVLFIKYTGLPRWY